MQEVLKRLVVPDHDAVGVGDRRIVRPMNESAARELEILPVIPIEHRVDAGVAMRPPGMGGRPLGRSHAPAGLIPTKWVGRSLVCCPGIAVQGEGCNTRIMHSRFRAFVSGQCLCIGVPPQSAASSYASGGGHAQAR